MLSEDSFDLPDSLDAVADLLFPLLLLLLRAEEPEPELAGLDALADSDLWTEVDLEAVGADPEEDLRALLADCSGREPELVLAAAEVEPEGCLDALTDCPDDDLLVDCPETDGDLLTELVDCTSEGFVLVLSVPVVEVSRLVFVLRFEEELVTVPLLFDLREFPALVED